jgi:hypothetical protein
MRSTPRAITPSIEDKAAESVDLALIKKELAEILALLKG